MAQPVWNTSAGSLGTFPALVNITITLSGSPVTPATSITYNLLSGILPDNVTLNSLGIISGTPPIVPENTTYTFVVRITDNLGNIADRTFTIDINGLATPIFTTPEGALPSTNDSVWYDFPIEYYNPIPSNQVEIKLIGGILPPGLEINEAGIIRGYADPPIITVTKPLITTTADLTSSANNSITCFSVTEITVGRPVTFTGAVFGGLVLGATYYVKSIDPLANTITVSLTQNGPTLLLTDDSGLMTVNFLGITIGEPITRTYSFELKLESILGSQTSIFSITVFNQTPNPRNPVIYNTRPPTFTLSDSDLYFGYYVLPSQDVQPALTGTATATFSVTNTILLDSVVGFQVGRKIIFTGNVFGNITSYTTYYITYIDFNNDLITISTSQNGSNFILTSGSGSMGVNLPPGPIYDVYPISTPAYIGKFSSDDFFAFKVIGHDFQGDPIRYQFSNITNFNLSTNTPIGLPSLQNDNGWITGTPLLATTGISIFSFDVEVFKVANPVVRSQKVTFSFEVIKNLDGILLWNSLSNLGTISNGSLCTKKIEVICDTAIEFRILSGSLPPNLQLQPDGEITGYVAFQTTNEFINAGEETIYTFTVEAYSPLYPSITSTQTFTLTVVQEFSQPLDSLYIKATPSFHDRQIIDSLLNDPSLIPSNYLYRPEDSNFGKATDVIYQHAYGIYASNLDEYIEAITKNHYWRNITLGELKNAVAKNQYGDIVYEVVYSEVIDNLVNPNNEALPISITWPRNIPLSLSYSYTSLTSIYTSYVFGTDPIQFEITASSSSNNTFTCVSTAELEIGREIMFSNSVFGNVDTVTTYYINTIESNTTFTISTIPFEGTSFSLATASGTMTATYYQPKYYTSLTPGTTRVLYPNGLKNMRDRVGLELGQEFDSDILPLWMTSQQSNGSTLGFTQAWVICYTKPGLSSQVKDLINNNWQYKLNQINFQIDRFTVNKSLTYDYDNNLIPASWTSLPSATPIPNPIDSKDFYVIFPRKTILPNSNQ